MQESVNPKIRKADTGDLDEIVRVHKSAFPRSFLSGVGPAFLKMLYESFVLERDGVLLVAQEGSGVTAFLAGTRSPETFFKEMRKKKGIRMGLAAISSVVHHPIRLAHRLVVALRYKGDQSDSIRGYWLLSSLGVAAASSGKGFGSKMVTHYCSMAQAEGALGVYLLTDGDANDSALRFYERQGFVVHKIMSQHHGRKMLTLARRFES
jgi:ribosomal protein S18 acetylase RimI-like enzyme